MDRIQWRPTGPRANFCAPDAEGLSDDLPMVRNYPAKMLGGESAKVTRLADLRADAIPLDADTYLAGLTNYEHTGFAHQPSIDRARALMEALGDPQRHLHTIHITGTNGKGSTANIAAALLSATGRRVGLYTSPHLQAVNERISVNGEPISDAALAMALDQVRRAALSRSFDPTWFEALTAAAFWHFNQHDVDAAVIEVGMLGRWDATNVIDARVAVVTNVELDHTEVAGPTRDLIALEKAGIICEGATLVLGEADSTLMPVFEQQRPGTILLVDRDFGAVNHNHAWACPLADIRTPWSTHERIPMRLAGGFQASNAAMALTAVESFLDAPMQPAAVASVLSRITLPGRFEIVRRSPNVIVDCAHNEAAALRLRPLMTHNTVTTGKRVLLCGLTAGRDPLGFLHNAAADSFDHIVITEPDTTRAVPVDETASAASRFGRPMEAYSDIPAALQRAIAVAGDDGLVVALGSYYLVGPVRALLSVAAQGQ